MIIIFCWLVIYLFYTRWRMTRSHLSTQKMVAQEGHHSLKVFSWTFWLVYVIRTLFEMWKNQWGYVGWLHYISSEYFAEEPAGFKILHTTQSISLHVYSFILCLQLFLLWWQSPHWWEFIVSLHWSFMREKTCCVYSINKKFERRNLLNF